MVIDGGSEHDRDDYSVPIDSDYDDVASVTVNGAPANYYFLNSCKG